MVEKVRQAFLALGYEFPIFPSPQGCNKHGAKVDFNATLERISKEMEMGRPATMKLNDLKKPPPGWVLKREYSDTGRDVYVPSLAPTSRRGEEIKEAAAFIRRRNCEAKDDICSWLCQELVPFLSIGEFRSLCVNGTPVRDVTSGRYPKDHPENPDKLWFREDMDDLKPRSTLQ